MKFFAAIKQAEFAEQLFANAGLDLSKLVAAGDVNALKAHLESLKPSADAAKFEADLVVASQKIETLEGALAEAKAENDELSVKLKASEEAAKPSEQKVAIKARELLAKNGVSAPISAAPSADASRPSNQGARTITYAEFSTMSPGEKMKFCKSGGRISEMPLNN